MHECPIPDSVMHDDDAVEMLRVWTADQTMYCSMKIGMYRETKKVPEEAIWGVILADVARQVSTTLQQSYPRMNTDSLALVREHFLKELGAPTAVSSDGTSRQHH
ncbi:hypothetical protein PHO31112_04182 [Pandoraea horticolens]|uniref:DUF5076 domain-containing protein n=1 Tax=Pandoraea horticolens TaxID=2508298 RepID=A0A5E4XYZ2_9BURK|nr:DUF5076 domain-containing protein [Pandoraea horticolens]VVE41681.1 hypothetical protein PHO31112_04182 [Pandoraea horticolens]